MGSRHRDEAFGDPYELPPDRAYAETCAAIASVMLAWRLLLATGEPRYADAIERAIYNGVLSGLSLTRHRVLLHQPAAAPHPPGRRAGRPRRARALVPVRLLPAQPDAAAQLVAAVPGHRRRRRRPDPPVRVGRHRGGHRRAARSGCRSRTGLPVGRPGRPSTSSRRRTEPWTLSLRVPRLVPVGDRSRCPARAPAAVGAGHGRARPAVAGRRRRSSSTSTCRSGSPSPTRGSTRCAAASRSSAARWSTASSRPTCRRGRSSRTCAGTRRRQPVEVAAAGPRRRRGGRRRCRSCTCARTGPPATLTAGAIPYFAWANRRRRGHAGVDPALTVPRPLPAGGRRGRVAHDQRRLEDVEARLARPRSGRGPGRPRGRRRG